MDNISVIILTLLLSALFSGLEIAFISANKLKIEVDKNQGLAYAKLLSELTRTPARFLGSMLVANNIVVVIYGMAMESLLGNYFQASLPGFFQNAAWILILQTLISALIILIFGEFIPKSLFRMNSNQVLKIFSFIAYLFYLLLYPIVFILTALSERLLKSLFKVEFTSDSYVFTMVDLDNYLKEFSGSNLVSQGEQDPDIQMFQNAMDFRNARVRECMVPRTEIKAIDEKCSVDELLQLSVETGHSKIMVYHETIDNIIGYTHSFDLFNHPSTISDIVKEIIVVPEAMLANDVLQTMLKERKSIAVVVDEFGGTSGIVAMEDIIEEIFGEIKDEYDIDDQVEKQLGKTEFLFSGRLEIDYLNEKYKLELPESEDYETLAGFIISHHKSIPDVNDEIHIDPYVFTITSASENRIDQVRMKIIS
jgi:putative hemolysin